MADQRNERDLLGHAVQRLRAGEAEPGLAIRGRIASPLRPRSPLLRPISLAVEPRRLLHGRHPFRFEQVHARVWKVVESAGVVEVEVREHDVAHVLWFEPQPLHLADGRELLAKIGAEQREKESTEPAARVAHVTRAKTGVHQGEAVRGFDQQAVAAQCTARHEAGCATVHEAAAEGAGRDAVQMVDADYQG